jgi:putative restriction endonuclease
MRLYIAVTDYDWFKHLKDLETDEVNFWQPGGSRLFKTLVSGEPFLFKLHSPRNFIVGGGFFAHASLLPTSLAWDAFEEKNGASSLLEMRRRIEKYRRVAPHPHEDYQIGCVILEQPFFLDERDWIPTPMDFAPNIVQGRGYGMASGTGAYLWAAVQSRLATGSHPQVRELPPTRGEPVLVRPRLGQGSFRVVVTDVYERRCAITGEKVLPVLEAAHIKPISEGGQHETANGLLLRSDLHRLFDRGYVTVTPDHRCRVSRKLKADFHNGEEYMQLAGSELWLPRAAEDRPNREFLEWHADTVFIG